MKIFTSTFLNFTPFIQVYSKTIVRTTVNMSYKIIGDNTIVEAPPILIFHGLYGSKKNWEPLAKTIKTMTKRTVLAVDLRNHGDSPHSSSHKYTELAKDIRQLLNRLEIKTASLVGHDMGGKACMCLALLEPKLVDRLLVVDASPVSTSVQMSNYYKKIMEVMKQIDFKGHTKLRKLRKAAKHKLRALLEDDFMVNVLVGNIKILKDGTIGWACNIENILHNLHFIEGFPTMKGKKFPGPTLFIGGQLSEALP